MPLLLLYVSPCIFIATFNEISCLIVFPAFCFTLALASYNFFSKFQSVNVSNAKADKLRIWSAFAAVGFCNLAPCNWTGAMATLPSTGFCESHCAQSRRVSDFCELQSYTSIALKSLPCEWLLRFDYFGGVSGNIALTKSHVNFAPCKWPTGLRNLRKKKGKMSILAAKSRPCKCSFTTTLIVKFVFNP